MVYQYYIDQDVSCIFICHYGEYELDEGVAALRLVIQDPQHQPDMNILRDTLQTALPKEQTFERFLDNRAKNIKPIISKFGRCRFAWVVGTTKDYGTAHRWAVTERLQADIERSAFRDIDKARAWLNIPASYEITFPARRDTPRE